MKLTIVPEDRLICIGSTFCADIQQDLSWIPSNVHAVQWHDSSGEIEYNDGTPNEIISDLGIYAQAQTDFSNEIQRIAAAREAARDYWQELRDQRNQLLAETDYLALVDLTLSADMRTYRQALRDLPANTSDPANPVWPTPPS
tara:strand:- start:85 stop:513 length:429 start_codon:yes stop_codon:yes gene_type:complete